MLSPHDRWHLGSGKIPPFESKGTVRTHYKPATMQTVDKFKTQRPVHGVWGGKA
jgi:hypothetical protein